ncbi:unnamed protein product [Lepeophtheirus salmonis]|uniref:(salmon louse) hypothetical protein n=1 Tax=Lepeophtheirus salmonis TaxID=72036 RepID=A0A7R8H3S5_LEPSM|nr:unnamed protein product [Lepeophtheirus salmonis]CAF2847101.1 unnamed protein product [Lepeophtheirus salmonis]
MLKSTTHPRSIEEKLRQILHVEKYGDFRKSEESDILQTSSLFLFSNSKKSYKTTRHPSSLAVMRVQTKSLKKIASGTNQGAIDNRIEQAMDLVKSHLMNAVRSEVEELKERIVKLEDVISHLQTENDFLKANVSQEVLTQLPPPTSSHHQILQQGPQVPQSISGHTPGNNPQGGLSPTSSPLVVTTQHQQQL